MSTKPISDIKTLKNHAVNIAAALAKPAVVFYTLPPLMLLLVTGTLAQRPLGLYDAQKMFFSSFILWLGPVPLPGGYSLIALISASLLIKFLFFSDWSLRKAGINLAHLGVLVMLIGGLLTALYAREGFIAIPEGGHSAAISDYHQRELLVVKDNRIIAAIPHQKIRPGRTLRLEGTPLTITVHNACRNCKIYKREDSKEDYGVPFLGMGRFMALKPAPLEKQEETNLYGATIGLSGAGKDYDGTYVIFEAMPKPIHVEKDGVSYELIYGKKQRPLPFTLELEHFEKKSYPGTAMARAYRSDIIVDDGGTRWPVRIEMNKPLRYKGYTFFQSSFAESGEQKATILSVVKNRGWLFPYIGVAIIAIGLLLHTIIMVRERGRES